MKTKLAAQRGALIVFEGIDGSGKSTQIKKMKKYVEDRLYRKVLVVRWKSSRLVGEYLNNLRKLDEQPSPLALSLIVAADLSENVVKKILPALAQGKVVLCDRYSFTGIVRDSVVNHCQLSWLEDLYSFVPKPDKVLYFKVNAPTSIQRVDSRLERGLSKLLQVLRKKYKNLSHKKVQSLLADLKGSMSEGSMAGSMEDTLHALKRGELLFQVNGDPLTEEVARKQREELISALIHAYDRIGKASKFVPIDAMKSVKVVSWLVQSELDSLLKKS